MEVTLFLNATESCSTDNVGYKSHVIVRLQSGKGYLVELELEKSPYYFPI